MATTEDAEAPTGADRDHLVRLGLLPNPDGEAMLAEGIRSRPPSVLADVMQGVVHNLAERVEDAYADNRRLAGQLRAAGDDASQAHRALNWLRENYDLDEIALEVIEHVTGDHGKVRYLW